LVFLIHAEYPPLVQKKNGQHLTLTHLPAVLTVLMLINTRLIPINHKHKHTDTAVSPMHATLNTPNTHMKYYWPVTQILMSVDQFSGYQSCIHCGSSFQRIY